MKGWEREKQTEQTKIRPQDEPANEHYKTPEKQSKTTLKTKADKLNNYTNMKIMALK